MSKPCFDWHQRKTPESSRHLNSSLNYANAKAFKTELLSSLQEMNSLSAILTHLSCKVGLTHYEVVSFNRHRASLEQRILCLPVATANTPEDELDAHIFNASRVAGLICANYLLRELSPMLVVLDRLRQNLAEILALIKDPEKGKARTSSKEMLLWVYFVGGMICPRREGYARNIATLMKSLSMNDWQTLDKCLKRHLLPAKMYDENCRALWAEVKAKRSLLALETCNDT